MKGEFVGSLENLFAICYKPAFSDFTNNEPW